MTDEAIIKKANERILKDLDPKNIKHWTREKLAAFKGPILLFKNDYYLQLEEHDVKFITLDETILEEAISPSYRPALVDALNWMDLCLRTKEGEDAQNYAACQLQQILDLS